mgnify:CR=1 FL=1
MGHIPFLYANFSTSLQRTVRYHSPYSFFFFFFFIFYFFYFFFFVNHILDKDCQELRNPPDSTSQVFGLKVSATTPGSLAIFCPGCSYSQACPPGHALPIHPPMGPFSCFFFPLLHGLFQRHQGWELKCHQPFFLPAAGIRCVY